jgi:hypothetical protein
MGGSIVEGRVEVNRAIGWIALTRARYPGQHGFSPFGASVH